MSKFKLYECFEQWRQRGSIWLFSDPHFSDPDAKFFRTKDIADEEIVKNINSKVSNNDTIVFLGDIGDANFIKKVRGYKVLVKGNHDGGSANYQRKVRVINNITNKEVDNLDNVIYRDQVLSYWKVKIVDFKLGYSSDYNDVRIEDNHLFDEVYEGPVMLNEKLVLSHEPIPNINWALNIHGHVHRMDEEDDFYHLNVCAEHIDYMPVCLKNIIESGRLKDIESLHRITINNASDKGKAPRHIVGKPMYKHNDTVCFTIKTTSGEVVKRRGYICIIDACGTFEQNDEPSYDIMVDNWNGSGEACLVKHIRESQLKACSALD